MRVVVQHLESEQFLGATGNWVRERASARAFTDFVQGISFCIQRNARMVRLVATSDSDTQETHFYPFGGDPVAKAERKKLRRLVNESRRLQHERAKTRALIDMLMAEGKEKKKQFTFRRKAADAGGAGTA